VSEHSSKLLGYYRKYRIDDQLDFYAKRKDLFDRATGQGLAVSAMLLGLASAVSALAGTTVGWTGVWSAASAILPAISTALAGYLALYAFDQQAKIYGDAVRAVHAAARSVPDPDFPQGGRPPEENIADFVKNVEGAFRQENAQWGQLTAQTQITDQADGWAGERPARL
jgi:SMODS and SLOG-associating 2TM effector domain 1